jgi:hypothetical protein
MKIEYQITAGKIPTKENIKACDDGAKAFQNLIVETARIMSNKIGVLIAWTVTRFYKRTITPEKISYDFYLIK